MFALPIGLQARTRDFPFATIAIFVVTCAYSFLYMDLSNQFALRYLSEETLEERVHEQKALSIAACSEYLEPRECALLPEILKPEKKESYAFLRLRLQAEGSQYESHGLSMDRWQEMLTYMNEDANWKAPSPAVSGLPEYARYQVAVAAEQAAMSEHLQSFGLLSLSTHDFKSLLRAQFLHAGWAHLIGNMLFFLLFAIPIEQRLGAAALFVIYFIGGAAGLELQLMSMDNPVTPLLGASANVFAVAAAFMIAFWSLSVRVWVSFFLATNQIVLVPTWLFFPLFILLQEVTGAVNMGGAGVAHLAHLGGFGVGAVLAFFAVRQRILPEGFVFPFEYQLFEAIGREQDQEKRLRLARQVLVYHPGNQIILEEAWDLMNSRLKNNWTELSEPTRLFVKEHFARLLKHKSESGTGELRDFLNTLHGKNWEWSELLASSDQARALKNTQALTAADENHAALTLVTILIAAVEGKATAGKREKPGRAMQGNLQNLIKLRDDLMKKAYANQETPRDEIRATGTN